MPLKVYNSLTKQKEDFIPINPPHVGMYVCGPTVSGESHWAMQGLISLLMSCTGTCYILVIRCVMCATLLMQGILKKKAEKRKIKSPKKRCLEKLEPMELVQKYTNLFHWAFRQFNTLDPNIEPRLPAISLSRSI